MKRKNFFPAPRFLHINFTPGESQPKQQGPFVIAWLASLALLIIYYISYAYLVLLAIGITGEKHDHPSLTRHDAVVIKNLFLYILHFIHSKKRRTFKSELCSASCSYWERSLSLFPLPPLSLHFLEISLKTHSSPAAATAAGVVWIEKGFFPCTIFWLFFVASFFFFSIICWYFKKD